MNKSAAAPDLIEDVCDKLRILSVETRLHMLLLLRQRNLCVGALARRLGLTQGAISQHLKVLRDAGLVTAERDGYYMHYRVDQQTLAQWQQAIDETLEQLQEEQVRGAVADETAAANSKRQKEDTCARKMNKPVVEKGRT